MVPFWVLYRLLFSLITDHFFSPLFFFQVQVLLAQIQTSERLLQGLQVTVSETQRQTQVQMVSKAEGGQLGGEP